MAHTGGGLWGTVCLSSVPGWGGGGGIGLRIDCIKHCRNLGLEGGEARGSGWTLSRASGGGLFQEEGSESPFSSLMSAHSTASFPEIPDEGHACGKESDVLQGPDSACHGTAEGSEQ